MKSSRSTLLLLFALTFVMCHFGANAATCSDSVINNLVLHTENVVYATSATPAPIQWVEASTRTLNGAFVGTGAETITVVAPVGVAITGTLTRTSIDGLANFSDLMYTSSTRGAFQVGFLLCGGVRTDYLQIIMRSNSGVKIIWTAPVMLNSITSYGYIPIRPTLAFADVLGNVTDMPSLDPWTLQINNSAIGITNFNFQPTLSSGQIASFRNLSFAVRDANAETVILLKLYSVGNLYANNTRGIAFPPPLAIKIAKCNSDFTISPSDGRATLKHFNIEYGNGAIGIRGWAFLQQLEATARCRYNGLSYPIKWLDVCNIDCIIPPSSPPNTGLLLEYSPGGVVFQDIGKVAILNMSQLFLKSTSPAGGSVYVMRDSISNVTAPMIVVDTLGTFVYRFLPNSPALNVTCTTPAVFANRNRLFTTYEHPFLHLQVTPDPTPSLVNGSASVDFVFGNNCEGDTYVYCCTAPGIQSGCVNVNILETCPSPPFVLKVTSQSCTPLPNSDLVNCSTNGWANVTVEGGNFGRSNVSIRIGPYLCERVIHDLLDPARIIYGINCAGIGQRLTVYVLRPIEQTWGQWEGKFSYSLPPIIYSISGCASNYYPSTANCKTDGTDLVSIVGDNFGLLGMKVYFYYFKAPGSIVRIEAGTVIPVSNQVINATGFKGVGSRFAVAVQTFSNETLIQYEVTMSYAFTITIPCASTAAGMCNQRGNCNFTSGFCECLSDPVNGFWVNSSCNTCLPFTATSSCTVLCPRDQNGDVCGGLQRGYCLEGVTGSGKCVCSRGYGGLACDVVCPNGVSLPCSGHGTCVQGIAAPYCECTATAKEGTWNGTLCDRCGAAYVGSNCTLKCPEFYINPKVNCMGRGTCKAAAVTAVCVCNNSTCGAACEYEPQVCGVCPAGKYGQNCALQCPGFGTGAGVCSSNGDCQSGTLGTGTCVCNPGFSGVNCEKSCPIKGGLRCSGHGDCGELTGTCRCAPYWGTADCSVSCPGLGDANGVCNSAGSCTVATALCECYSGHAGANCNITCQGGVQTPCSNHGICRYDGSCQCYNDSVSGYFTDVDCHSCQNTWFGASCNRQCVKTNGSQCNNKGKCITTSVTCACNNDIILGFWAEPNCTVCKPNYYGEDCIRSCPGGACNACSRNGICSDGLKGDGSCKCYSNVTTGFWTGPKCENCKSSYYGINCNLKCPEAQNGLSCGGHGLCSEGLRGNGLCACHASPETGYWTGASCLSCASGFFGKNCTQRCLGLVSVAGGKIEPCFGHGTCNAGDKGDGTCTCAKNYGTQDCSVGCPIINSRVCNQHGTCNDGANSTGTCTCYSLPNEGYWSGDGCKSCQLGYFGKDCINPCPQSDGLICGGNGFCDQGVTGTGICNCSTGWSGTRCTRPCDGGVLNPCTGHGTCQQTDGSCICSASPLFGFWAGQNCTECDALYLSSDCTVPCPVAGVNATEACNGQGRCLQGQCSECASGYCGEACQTNDASCNAQNCPYGKWGEGCLKSCPGIDNENGTVCSGYGACSVGISGTGLCTCRSGSFGPECKGECPGGRSTPCSNFGSCNSKSGECSCRVGYATADCSVTCPGGPASVCSNNGVCSPSTGVCGCFTGFGRLDCSKECPGGARNRCNLHGTCDPLTAECKCTDNDQFGHWAGLQCNECAATYYGPTCTARCSANGATFGQECICKKYFSGPDCSQKCPAGPDAFTAVQEGVTTVCNAHGTCLYGNNYTTGTCQCDATYYKADCSVVCTLEMCSSAPFFYAHPRCDSATGTCACANDTTNGLWSDKTAKGGASLCQDCQLFFWGANCIKPCNCLRRGGCDQNTGQCNCFDDDTRGHYSGSSCQTCAAGYIGAKCTETDVTITRQRPCSTIIDIIEKSSFTLVDSENGILITGGRPLVLCNLTTRTYIREANNLNATVISGFIVGNKYYLMLTKMDSETDKRTIQNVAVDRGSNPSFIVTRRGNKALPTSAEFQIAARQNSYLEIAAPAANAAGGGGAPSSHFSPNLLRRDVYREQSAAVYNGAIVVETIVFGDNRRLIVSSDGKIQQVADLDFLMPYDGSQYFDTVFGASLTNNVLINPSVLILGGNYNGTWRMMAFPMNGAQLGSGPPLDVTALLRPKTDLCAVHGCVSIGKLVCDGTFVILAVLTNSGAGLVRFRYTALFATLSLEYSIILSSYSNTTVFNVTALVLDTYGAAGYLAINLANSDGLQPSTIYRFSLVTLAVSGTVSFQKVVDTYEVVTAIVSDDSTRTLYAVIPLLQQISVVPLNLFAVTRIFPTFADTFGGTRITVQGEGFSNLSFVYCNFNGTILPGKYVSSEEIHCVAPTGGDERCLGVPLEVTVAPGQFTNNQVMLRRVSSPRISKVYNLLYASDTEYAYGSVDGGASVTLEGFGFQDTDFFACRFLGPNEVGYSYKADYDYQYSHGSQGILINDANFSNSTMVQCNQPTFPFPTSGPATVEVTLDGTVYSRSGLTYEVVGAADDLLAFQQQKDGKWIHQFYDVYTSAAEVHLNDIHVWVVDSENQRLRMLDALKSRDITVTMRPGSFVSNERSNSTNQTVVCQNKTILATDPVMYSLNRTKETTVRGYATFTGIYFKTPPAGIYTLTFIDKKSNWEYNFTFAINVGNAHKLKICVQPSNQTNNLQPTLKQQPTLYAVDFAGNQLTAAALQAQLIHVTASYKYETTVTRAVGDTTGSTKVLVGIPINVTTDSSVETRVAQIKNNFLQFEGIELQGLYGRTYYIDFTSPGLINVTSSGISVQWCNNNTARVQVDPTTLMYFAKWNTSECFVCPVGGVCDGTTALQAGADNLWRADYESYVFYTCATPYGGDSCYAPNGTCKLGYKGPRCASCIEGYGRNGFFCEVCPAPGSIFGYAILILIICGLFVAAITYISLTSFAVDALPPALRLAINYFQVSSRINFVQTFPKTLSLIYIAQWDISELIRFDAIPVECDPLNLSVYKQFYFALGVPFVVLGVAAIGLFALNVYRTHKGIGPKFIPVPFATGGQKVRRERVMLAVARFMSRIRAAAAESRGDGIRRDDSRPQFYTAWEYFTVVAIVIFTLCYPSIVQWCLVMWKCEDIISGDGATFKQSSVLILDRTIDCGATEHKLVQLCALAAALVYGLVIPVLSCVLVSRSWWEFGGLHARRLYCYITSGYDREMWWWEITVAARKFLVIVIIMIIGDPILRTYLMMWTMAVSLGLHGWLQPFDVVRPSLYYLDGFGITTIVLTLNLSLLFQFPSFAEGTPGNTALVIVLLLMNMFATCTFFAFLGRHVFMRVKYVFFHEEEDIDTTSLAPVKSFRKRASSIFGGYEDEGKDGAGKKDRRTIQQEGVLGLLRRASLAGGKAKEDTANAPVDRTAVPINQGETPLERLKRLELERRKQFLRRDQAKTQGELEEELAELKERLTRAEALSKAEEAVIRRNPHMAERRKQHEAELMKLMDLIRKERGEINRDEEQTGQDQRIEFEDEDEDEFYEEDY